MDNTLKFGLSDSLINAVREVVEGKVCPTCGKSPCQCDGDVKKVEEERMSKGRRDALARKTSFTADPPRRLEKPEPKETKSDKMKAYRADRDKHGEMEEDVEQRVDMKGKKCTSCKKGTYQETSQMDDMDGVVHCTKCGKGLKRHQKAQAKTNEGVESIDEVSLKTKINAYKAAKDPEADYSYGSKVHDQADRIHKNIVAKHGAKAGEHADRAAYGKPSTPASRSAEKAKPDVLKRDTTHPMRITKSGVAHKQDQKSNAAVIKSRLGKHGKSNIPEEVQFSEAEIARIESILKDL